MLLTKNNWWKISILYFGYNMYTKIFFSIINHIIYVEYPEKIDSVSFFVISKNFLISFLESTSRVIVSDLLWLAPYTVMNMFVFLVLIDSLLKEQSNFLSRLTLLLMKVYLLWVLVYLFSIGLGTNLKESGIGSFLSGPFSPYGSYTITYFLLGNFTFFYIVDIFLKKILSRWIKN